MLRRTRKSKNTSLATNGTIETWSRGANVYQNVAIGARIARRTYALIVDRAQCYTLATVLTRIRTAKINQCATVGVCILRWTYTIVAAYAWCTRETEAAILAWRTVAEVYAVLTHATGPAAWTTARVTIQQWCTYATVHAWSTQTIINLC